VVALAATWCQRTGVSTMTARRREKSAGSDVAEERHTGDVPYRSGPQGRPLLWVALASRLQRADRYLWKRQGLQSTLTLGDSELAGAKKRWSSSVCGETGEPKSMDGMVQARCDEGACQTPI
jgi:hypothetical protein